MAALWRSRRAVEADLAAIMPLEASTFGTDAWSASSMRQELRNPQCYYLVAFREESPETIEAYAGLLAPPGAREGDIQTIAVAEPARRTGLGRTLMQQLLGEARARGIREVFLEVRADNPGAQNLYRLLGFEEVGVRRGYYQPDGVDARVMRLELPVSPAAPVVNPGSLEGPSR